jgi:DoxX-like family
MRAKGTMSTQLANSSSSPSKSLIIGLWAAQAFLALTFVGGGVWKLATPLPALAAMMPWVGQVSPSFFYLTAVCDVLGGLGVLLPSLTRVKPQLTVLAALGCVALMVCAIIFHLARGEAANTPFNFLMLALSVFVAWGRRSPAPIARR